VDESGFLRNFDPRENAVTFRGDYYRLGPVVQAIVTLIKKIETLTKQKGTSRTIEKALKEFSECNEVGMKYQNITFENQTVHIDFNEYFSCNFLKL